MVPIFDSFDDVIAAERHFLDAQDTDFYKEGITMLSDGWTKSADGVDCDKS